jgi:polyhydroxyalkanoate synthesis regulator phasin
MLDIVRKTLLLGIGLAAMTRDKIEEVAKKIAEEDKLSEEEGRKLAEDLLNQSDEARKNLKEQVEKFVDNTLDKLKSQSRKDLQNLEERVAKLEKLQKVE